MKKSIFFTLVLVLISCNTKKNDNSLENNQASSKTNKDSLNIIQEEIKMEEVYNFNIESFNNWLKKGLKESLIIDKLGNRYKDSLFFSEVSGLDSKILEYNDKGLILWFEKNKKDFYLTQIEVKNNNEWKTIKGIAVGDDEKKVFESYKGFINNEETYEEAIVIGDVYDGLFFIVENKKVKEIILGSLAE